MTLVVGSYSDDNLRVCDFLSAGDELLEAGKFPLLMAAARAVFSKGMVSRGKRYGFARSNLWFCKVKGMVLRCGGGKSCFSFVACPFSVATVWLGKRRFLKSCFFCLKLSDATVWLGKGARTGWGRGGLPCPKSVFPCCFNGFLRFDSASGFLVFVLFCSAFVSFCMACA